MCSQLQFTGLPVTTISSLPFPAPRGLPAVDGLRLEILQLLKTRWDTARESGRPFIVTRKELVGQLCLPETELGTQLVTLESDRCITRVCLAVADANPGYYITALGDRLAGSLTEPRARQ